MFEMLEKFHLDIMVGIGIPAVGAMVFIIRHFWIKTKCFYLMKYRLEQIEKESIEGKKTHVEIFQRLNAIDKHTANIEGKIDMLIEDKKLYGKT